MGALKGSASYLTLTVDENTVLDLDAAERHIELRRFVPLTQESESQCSMGWVPFEDPYDDVNPILRDRFHFNGNLVCLAYRSDEIKISSAVLRHMVDVRCAELAEETGEKVDKTMKDAIKLACGEELKLKTPPKTTIVEGIWNISTNRLRVFGSKSQKEQFTGCFERTFDTITYDLDFISEAVDMDLPPASRALLACVGSETAFSHNIIREV